MAVYLLLIVSLSWSSAVPCARPASLAVLQSLAGPSAAVCVNFAAPVYEAHIRFHCKPFGTYVDVYTAAVADQRASTHQRNNTTCVSQSFLRSMSSPTLEKWVVRRRPNPSASIRLFCAVRGFFLVFCCCCACCACEENSSTQYTAKTCAQIVCRILRLLCACSSYIHTYVHRPCYALRVRDGHAKRSTTLRLLL